MHKCFVIQPFDHKFDNRFKDTFEPAIKKAGLIPYRVDNDLTTIKPIESIEEGIKNSKIVFADITTDNPNVWYELGFAFACNKKIIMVCCKDERSDHFPFDIRHRSIIEYKSGTKSDFEKLEQGITLKIKALVKTKDIYDYSIDKIPNGIQNYINDFPQFNNIADIKRGYVKTSRESFFIGLKSVLEDLHTNTKVISTDSINLTKFSQYLHYWAKEGLPYLKLNYLANEKKIKFIRIFIVDEDEYQKNKPYFFKLASLHKCAGVEPRYIFYQNLLDTPSYLREFAVFGNKYVDETIYDIRSYRVIENYIHWGSDIITTFTERAKVLENLSLEFEGMHQIKKLKTIDSLNKYAESCLNEEIKIKK
ncbi:MAG: hypothetical protein IPK62_01960 [Bacteroidetes bacterium]|jgi:hypothetical protein|nr:hypothetical protein [Bacteroidota bacterium]MBK8143837.1 hypothetical protein [Bacteroidota bacterium]MBP6314407.1 hypothetical protein [Chitinophagaceae bacterium]